MAKCGSCGTTILMGGTRLGDRRFCNRKCAQKAAAIEAAKRIPAGVIEQMMTDIRQKNCPKCAGTGPVDARRFYYVWSALYLTRWKTTTEISCRSCATRRSIRAIASCSLLGWWGLPWGIFVTPAQIVRNIRAMRRGSDGSHASQALRSYVVSRLGAKALADESAGQVSGGFPGAGPVTPGR